MRLSRKQVVERSLVLQFVEWKILASVVYRSVQAKVLHVENLMRRRKLWAWECLIIDEVHPRQYYGSRHPPNHELYQALYAQTTSSSTETLLTTDANID